MFFDFNSCFPFPFSEKLRKGYFVPSAAERLTYHCKNIIDALTSPNGVCS